MSSRDDLIGYLLGALDEADRLRVHRALDLDPQLRQQLDSLRSQLNCLDSTNNEHAPPDNLAEHTCDLIDAFEEFETQRRKTPDASDRSCQSARLRPAEFAGCESPSRRSLVDAFVAGGVAMAICLLFFPAIASSRFQSHVRMCEYNLQQMGYALTNFSDKNGGMFPQIPAHGNRAAAGIIAPILLDGQFLCEDRVLICPASELAQRRDSYRIPQLAEVDRAEGKKLRALQRIMGGSYGYSLGYQRDGLYCPPRNENRCYFALMSDTPSQHLAGSRSGNHGGRGQNVLFEDNHVEFLVTAARGAYSDNLFRNRQGFIRPGLDKEDSVIAPSAIRLVSY